jgi:hypothetical protein
MAASDPQGLGDREWKAEYARLRAVLADAQSLAGATHDSLEVRALADIITFALATWQYSWESSHHRA